MPYYMVDFDGNIIAHRNHWGPETVLETPDGKQIIINISNPKLEEIKNYVIKNAQFLTMKQIQQIMSGDTFRYSTFEGFPEQDIEWLL